MPHPQPARRQSHLHLTLCVVVSFLLNHGYNATPNLCLGPPLIPQSKPLSLLSTSTARSTHKIFKCTQSKNLPRSAKPSVYSPLKTLPLISNMYFSSYPLRHSPFQGHGILSDRKNRNDARNERRELGPLPVGVLPLLWDDFRRTNIDKRSCHHRKHGSVNER